MGLEAAAPSFTDQSRPSCAATKRRPEPSRGDAIASGPPSTLAYDSRLSEIVAGSTGLGRAEGETDGAPEDAAPVAPGVAGADAGTVDEGDAAGPSVGGELVAVGPHPATRAAVRRAVRRASGDVRKVGRGITQASYPTLARC
jgi:hypothetical protein